MLHVLEGLPRQPDVLFGVCRGDLREEIYELVAALLRLKDLVHHCEVLLVKGLILHRKYPLDDYVAHQLVVLVG